MTLGNMRDNGARSLFVSCWNCHHRAVLSADHWPDDVPVPTFDTRMDKPWKVANAICQLVNVSLGVQLHQKREKAMRRAVWQSPLFTRPIIRQC
jgi:hypothetical protein